MVYTVAGPGRRPMERVWSQAVSPNPMMRQLPGLGQAVQQVSEVIVQVTWRELGTAPASLREANPCLELPEIFVCAHEPGKDEVEFQILNPQENYTRHTGLSGWALERQRPSCERTAQGRARRALTWPPPSEGRQPREHSGI